MFEILLLKVNYLLNLQYELIVNLQRQIII